MYSVLVLGVVMLLHAFHFPVPEWVSPVATFAVIGYFFLRSVRATNRAGPPGRPGTGLPESAPSENSTS